MSKYEKKYEKVPEERIQRNANEDACWHNGWKVAAAHNRSVPEWQRMVVYQDHERIAYAVYLQGDLLCMLNHLESATKLMACRPDDFTTRMLDMHRQEAIDAGFTAYDPGHMTWRQIHNVIHCMDDKLLDMPALVMLKDSYGYIDCIDGDDEDESNTRWFQLSEDVEA